MIVVSDTSPITNLFGIGRLNLLRELYAEVVIPVAVAAEIDFLEQNREILSENAWIRIVQLRDQSLLLGLEDLLDPGEAEAIALSLELGADAVLIDEGVGRKEATRLGLDVTGLVGVLIQAKRRGLISLIRPEIERLVNDAGFWLNPTFISAALKSVDEE